MCHKACYKNELVGGARLMIISPYLPVNSDSMHDGGLLHINHREGPTEGHFFLMTLSVI